MKKKILMIIVTLILSFILTSCNVRHSHFYIKGTCICGEKELLNLEKIYDNEFKLIKDIYKDRFPSANAKFRLVEGENLSKESLNNLYDCYGEGFNSAIYGTVYEGEEVWFILEFDTIEHAQKAYETFNEKSLFLFKNLILCEFPARLSILYEYNVINDFVYVENGKILIYADISIKEIRLSNSVEIIESLVFVNAVNLEKVVCNDSLLRIQGGVFMRTPNLKNVKLNDRLEYIGEQAFNNSGLEYIVIPRSVEFIGSEAFNKCNVFCEAESKPKEWADDFAVDDAKVYYKGEWEYNEEGIPMPLI